MFSVRPSVGEWRPTLLVYGKLVYFVGFVRLYVFILFVSDYILCYFGLMCRYKISVFLAVLTFVI